LADWARRPASFFAAGLRGMTHIVAKTQAPDEPLQAVTAGAPVAASSPRHD